MGTPITYFKGVSREAKRVRWPDRSSFLTTIGVVLLITVIAGIFLALEDLAAGVIIEQMQNVFANNL